MKILKKEEVSVINGGNFPVQPIPYPPNVRNTIVIRLNSSGGYSSGSSMHDYLVESGSQGQP